MTLNNADALPCPVPPGTRCYNNCHPELFPVDMVRLGDGSQLKSGRRRYAKVSEEVLEETKQTLKTLRNTIAQRDFLHLIIPPPLDNY
ncbi:hypothetical protein K438DRAFT_1972212 [Mycena galopus ATCC 62051]|nr:hypothetical protein K438DRAFT_1972212 [Mycena galopus ATCC 62051]